MQAIVSRLLRVMGLLAALTLGGTLGYRIIEGWGWLDAVYMSVITLSTVGFQELRPLSAEGRTFTIFLILAGSGLALYLITLLAQLVLDGQLARSYRKDRMATQIRELRRHVIVAGYGRYGRSVVDELLRARREVVVIEHNPELEQVLQGQGLPYVLASASTDDGLIEAGIEGAEALVAATPSDAENVFITLAAKELNPEIRVHARYEAEATARRLERAGADQVVSPFQMGGSRTAAAILRPSVVDFLEILAPGTSTEVDLEQVVIGDRSTLVGSRIQAIEAEYPAVRVVALQRGEEPIVIAPGTAREIHKGDHIVVIGERAPLLELARRAEG